MTDKTDSRYEKYGPNTKRVASKKMTGSTAAKKPERKRKPAGQEGAITDRHEQQGLETTALSWVGYGSFSGARAVSSHLQRMNPGSR